jgi:hypothetical protein
VDKRDGYSPSTAVFPYQFLFHRLLHTHLSSGAGTIGPFAAAVVGDPPLRSPTAERKESRGRRLRVFEKRVLRRTFQPKEEEVTGENCLTRSLIVFTLRQIFLG